MKPLHLFLVLLLAISTSCYGKTFTVDPSLVISDPSSGIFKTISEAIDARGTPGPLTLYLNNGNHVFSSTLTVDGYLDPAITRLELIASNSLQAIISCRGSGYNPLLLRNISEIAITGVNFQGCSGTTNIKGGGALLVYVQSSLEIDSCRFSNNTGRKGGALSLVVDNFSMPTRSATITNSEFTQNIASNSGGAVFIESINTTFVNTVLSNNVASSEGGAVQMYRADTIYLRYGINFTNCVVTGNKAINGGGGLNLNTQVTEAYFVLINTIVSNNFVNATSTGGFSQGGGMYVRNPAPLLVVNSVFTGNIALKGAVTTSFGGAIYVRHFAAANDISIQGSTFSQNVANTAAAFMVTNSNRTTITNSQFLSNQAVTSNGGILMVSSNVELTNVVVANNTGATYAVRAESSSKVYLTSSVITNNTNLVGFSCDASTVYFYHTSVYNNKPGNDFGCGAACQWNGLPAPCSQVCAYRDVCSVCNGTSACLSGCDQTAWSTAQNDLCDVCNGDNSTCTGCDGVPNSGKRFDACGICGGSNSTCTGCDGIVNSGKNLDACGICGGNNSTCTGCDGAVNSGKKIDACGVCDGNNSTCAGCDGVANSGKEVDACGLCGGNNSTCTGCDGVPNSGNKIDACGICGGNNSTCTGCDGVVNSGKEVDNCGVCGGNNSTCTGCDGVVNSGKKIDVCGVCGGNNSTCTGCDGVANSGKRFDACGICGGNNSTCTGCDGIVNSGKRFDACGVCGGNNSTCTGCDGIVNSAKKVDVCGLCGGDNSTCTYPTCSSGTVVSNYRCIQPASSSQCPFDTPLGNSTINAPYIVDTPLIGTSFSLTLGHKFVSSRIVRSIILASLPECNYPGPYWTKGVTSNCVDTYTSSIPWNIAFLCGLTKTQSETTVELSGSVVVNSVENATFINSNTVFQRSLSSSLEFRMIFPAQVFVSITNTVYGSGISFAIVSQMYDSNSGTLQVDVATSVIAPFKLISIAPVLLDNDLATTQSMLVDCGTSGDCVQFWRIIVTPMNNRCNFTGSYTFGFNRTCNTLDNCPQGSLLEVVAFSLETGQVCGYTETANVTASIASFASFAASTKTFSSPAVAFYHNEIVYFKLAVSREGPAVTQTSLKRVTATNSDAALVILYDNSTSKYDSFGTQFLGDFNGTHQHEFHFH